MRTSENGTTEIRMSKGSGVHVETPKPAKDYRNAASSMYHMVCTVYVHTKCGGILANFPQLKFVLP